MELPGTDLWGHPWLTRGLPWTDPGSACGLPGTDQGQTVELPGTDLGSRVELQDRPGSRVGYLGQTRGHPWLTRGVTGTDRGDPWSYPGQTRGHVWSYPGQTRTASAWTADAGSSSPASVLWFLESHLSLFLAVPGLRCCVSFFWLRRRAPLTVASLAGSSIAAAHGPNCSCTWDPPRPRACVGRQTLYRGAAGSPLPAFV